MKVALGTVYYSDARLFADEFINSIKNQTNQDFFLLIVVENDFDYEVIYEKIKNEFGSFLVLVNSDKNISSNRMLLIEKSKELNFDLLIFCDIDDTFKPDRVEMLVNSFDENVTFYYNDLQVFNQASKLWELPEETTSVKQILQSNYLGLSNTALNLGIFDDALIGKLKAYRDSIFDWYLFSMLLLHGLVGKKVNTTSYYRIHDKNMIGLNKSLHKEITTKLGLYKALAPYSCIYEKLLTHIIELDSSIDNQEYSTDSERIGWWNLIYFDLEEL